MFEIKKEHFGTMERFILKNTATNEYFSIIPSVGANINELVLCKDGIMHSVIDGYQSFGDLIENNGFKSAFLIPFPNRVCDGKYNSGEKDFQLPVNKADENHSIHGLLYNKPFTVVELIVNNNSATVELNYNFSKEQNVFPSGFATNLKVILNTDGLTINMKVKNTGNQDMPFGGGWHPYFKLEEKLDELQLRLPLVSKIKVDGRMIPTGITEIDKRFIKLNNIGSAQLDDGFVIDDKSDICETRLNAPSKNISINFWQENGAGKFNYLQVYTPPERSSLAIEPMSCSTNAFNNKQGLIILKPGEQFSASFGVRIE